MKDKKALEGSEPENDGVSGEMHFLDHLEEFRWVLIRSMIAFIVGCGLIMAFFPWVSHFLAAPLDSGVAKSDSEIGSLVTRGPMGVFTAFLQVGFMGGLSLSLPFIIFEFAKFLAPGLTKKERMMLFPGAIGSFFLFLSGAAFAYYFILPVSMFVSIQFNRLLGYEVLWSVSEYYSFVVWMILAVAMAFQFPLVLLLLQYVGILTPEKLRKSRSVVFVVIMVVSAIITPSDPLSMVALAAPLYILYEVSILIGASALKRKNKQKEAEEASESETDTDDTEELV